MNTATHRIAASFNTTVESLISLNETAQKNVVSAFKKGDVVACFAAEPNRVLCIVELTVDNPPVDNFRKYITGNSYQPLTSHLISGQWFKIN